jgi:endonuclease YncB( thermonuclease family)
LRVVDGDTFDIEFHSWQDEIKIRRVRLLAVNTPELRPRKGTAEEKAAEKQAALAALAYVQQIMDKADKITLITDWKADSFGRLLAAVEYTDGSGTHDLAAVLLQAGHATPYEK